jgi:D-arabinose 1-dehydrogenase-like Zn-dependent alcohol dehydrogenase
VGRIPEELDAVDAAPLLCAGITVFKLVARRIPRVTAPGEEADNKQNKY